MQKEGFELDTISVQFSGHEVLRDLSLKIPYGERLVLRGGSGSGKSTVLRLLLGLVQPSGGQIRYGDQPLTPANVQGLRNQTAYVEQSCDLGGGEVEQAFRRLEAFSAQRCAGESQSSQGLAALLEGYGLEPGFLRRDLAHLSGGERQRVALAVSESLNRPIRLLDEPTASLDEGAKRRVVDRVFGEARARPEGIIVVVSHDEVWRGLAGVREVVLDGAPKSSAKRGGAGE